MNIVKLVLTSFALYSLYCTLVMPYLTYCCEVWGNNYKTCIQSLFILQKRTIRIICLNTNYKCHTKPLFYQLRSLNVFDITDLKGSFTIVNIYLLVQRVLIEGEGVGMRPASVLFSKC